MDEYLQPFPTSFSKGGDIFVAASGEIRENDDSKMHRHDFYELVWLWQGACQFFSDFELYDLPQGSLIFVSPGQLHDYRVPDRFCRLLIIGFRPSVLPAVAHHLLQMLPFDDTQRNPTQVISSEQQQLIEQLFQAAHGRFDAKKQGWETIVTSYLQTILTESAYLMPSEFVDQSANAAVQITRAFQRALESHYRQRRQVQEYAEMLGVTSNYLVKTIRHTTSTTPKQMLQNRLLLEAKRLLVHTPHPVGQISELLDFPDSTTFARWFKKCTAQTPSRFRNHTPHA